MGPKLLKFQRVISSFQLAIWMILLIQRSESTVNNCDIYGYLSENP